MDNEIVKNPTNKEVVETPGYVLDAIERMNLSHPEYEG